MSHRTILSVHNWSGRISEGYPTTTALLAAHNGAGLSMPYLSFGGFSNTVGVAVFTRLNNAGDIRNIAKPELVLGDPNRRPYFGSEDWSSITRHRDTRMARLAPAPNLMPRDARNRELYAAALKPDAVDYLWDYAELQGVAHRLVVVMGSDFGRTNKYNAEACKDHWPIGSFVVMEKNQSWTNRVVGETDELHFARKINAGTLQRDDTSGTLIHPKHIHKALRKYLGVADTADSQRFPFHNTEELPLFS